LAGLIEVALAVELFRVSALPLTPPDEPVAPAAPPALPPLPWARAFDETSTAAISVDAINFFVIAIPQEIICDRRPTAHIVSRTKPIELTPTPKAREGSRLRELAPVGPRFERSRFVILFHSAMKARFGQAHTEPTLFRSNFHADDAEGIATVGAAIELVAIISPAYFPTDKARLKGIGLVETALLHGPSPLIEEAGAQYSQSPMIAEVRAMMLALGASC
jgi:hypothetical protein